MPFSMSYKMLTAPSMVSFCASPSSARTGSGRSSLQEVTPTPAFSVRMGKISWLQSKRIRALERPLFVRSAGAKAPPRTTGIPAMRGIEDQHLFPGCRHVDPVGFGGHNRTVPTLLVVKRQSLRRVGKSLFAHHHREPIHVALYSYPANLIL